jgi:integrase
MYKRNDKWYADFVINGKRYNKSLKTPSKSVAKELELKFKAEVLKGEYEQKLERIKQDMKFEMVLQEYLEKESVNKKSHRRDLVSKPHLVDYFGGKRLSQITPDNVTDFKFHRREEIIKKKQKPKEEINFATVNRELALLRRVFNWYASQKRIKLDNPVSGIEFFREKQRTRVMTEEEEKRFFTDGNPSPFLSNVVRFALYTGMRKSEILNLKREDVIMGELGGCIVLKDTKNGESRKVVLTKELTEFLKQVINEVPESEYVFSRKNSKPRADIKDSFNRICRAVGINDLRFHDLRHTFCTRMANEGVNPFTIMQIVGHKDTATAKRYINPTDTHLMAAMSKMSLQFSRQYQNDSDKPESMTPENKAFSIA